MHRRLVAIAAVLLLTANSAWALSCAQPLPYWWPGRASLTPNAFIVLANERLDAAWFESDKTRIDAVITTVGSYQVIRPKTPLTVGRRYTLGGTGPNRFAKAPWRWMGKGQAPLIWHVVADATSVPTWAGEIGVGEGKARRGGWGSTSSQVLNLSIRNTGPVIAEVVLVRGDTKRVLLLPARTSIRFGQGLCDGEVQLIGEGTWTAKVTLIGKSGQRSTTKTATFVTPEPKAI